MLRHLETALELGMSYRNLYLDPTVQSASAVPVLPDHLVLHSQSIPVGASQAQLTVSTG